MVRNIPELKYVNCVKLNMTLSWAYYMFLYSLSITFKEFVENIECGRQRIMFATTVIFITKSMSLDLFFLRFQYSFFRCFHIHEQQFDWRKMVVLSMERKERKRESTIDIKIEKGFVKLTLRWLDFQRRPQICFQCVTVLWNLFHLYIYTSCRFERNSWNNFVVEY